MNIGKQLKEGLITQNPVLVQLLGMCSTLAITTTISNGIGMGLSVTIILTLSNIFISLLRKFIPEQVRIACYIVVIAGFVTMVDLLLQAFFPDIAESLGVFIPLIVVNCIILGRAEMFANKNNPLDSALDAIGMGVGYTLAMLAMASIREIFGAGTWFGIAIPVLSENNISIMTMAPGGFAIFGILIAIINKASNGKAIKKKDFSCEGCPSAAACNGQNCAEKKKEAAAK